MSQRIALLIALIAGALAATGFAPLGLWPVTLIAFAVLVWLVGAAPSAKSAFARGWAFGVGHFTLGLNWIAHAFTFQDAMPHWFGWLAVVALSLYLAVYPALATWGTWLLAGKREEAQARIKSGPTSEGKVTPTKSTVTPNQSAATPNRSTVTPDLIRGPASSSLAFVFAALWIVTEYLRATMFTGFAWNPLAAIWAGTGVRGLTAWIGTYALSGMTVLLASLLLGGTYRSIAVRVAVAALIVLFTGLGLGTGGLQTLALRPVGPLVRIVQPNIGQALRNAADGDEARMQALERLTGPGSRTPRLILWPEAAVPFFLEQELFGRYRLSQLLGPRDLIVTGGDALVYDARGQLLAARNSVFAMTPDRRLLDRYDKAHLVPYGEYLPARPLLSAIGLSRLVPGDLDFMPGPGPRTMVLPGFGRAGIQLCYEIIFSGQVVDRRDRPDFVFNPSNDAWFGGWGPPQHLAQARLRAAEEGLPIVRATPTGISAVIDADGRLLAALPLGKPGFIQMRLPEAHPPTFFGRYGNMIPMALALMLLLAGVAPHALHRYRRTRT